MQSSLWLTNYIFCLWFVGMTCSASDRNASAFCDALKTPLAERPQKRQITRKCRVYKKVCAKLWFCIICCEEGCFANKYILFNCSDRIRKRSVAVHWDTILMLRSTSGHSARNETQNGSPHETMPNGRTKHLNWYWCGTDWTWLWLKPCNYNTRQSCSMQIAPKWSFCRLNTQNCIYGAVS